LRVKRMAKERPAGAHDAVIRKIEPGAARDRVAGGADTRRVVWTNGHEDRPSSDEGGSDRPAGTEWLTELLAALSRCG
jgi:hypothetical protein